MHAHAHDKSIQEWARAHHECVHMKATFLAFECPVYTTVTIWVVKTKHTRAHKFSNDTRDTRRENVEVSECNKQRSGTTERSNKTRRSTWCFGCSSSPPPSSSSSSPPPPGWTYVWGPQLELALPVHARGEWNDDKELHAAVCVRHPTDERNGLDRLAKPDTCARVSFRVFVCVCRVRMCRVFV